MTVGHGGGMEDGTASRAVALYISHIVCWCRGTTSIVSLHVVVLMMRSERGLRLSPTRGCFSLGLKYTAVDGSQAMPLRAARNGSEDERRSL